MSFYETEEFLLDTVASFVEEAIESGDAAIVIGRAARRSRLEVELGDRGVDVAELERTGRLGCVDAASLIERFMVDDVPDEARFRAVVSDEIDRADQHHGSVRIFGEMVAMLWDDGNVTGTLELEDLWNDLAYSRAFTLLCAYPMSAFASDDSTEAFHRVCDQHSAVLPTERLAGLSGEDQARTMAMLQQELLAADDARDEWRATRHGLQTRLAELDASGRSRERFVATVAHDIRTPTTLVSTAVGLLRASLPQRDDAVEQLLETAADSAARIERLVADVLTAAQIHAEGFSYDLRDVDMAQVIERTVREMRLSSGRTIELTRQEPLRNARADDERQRQILDNLLSNAVKFSPAGTPVAVDLTGSAGWLVVTVRDEGIGIATEDQATLFDPFSRISRNEVPGTGLGLSTVKALVEGQGGSIRVESAPGAGSVFSYTIPLAGAD